MRFPESLACVPEFGVKIGFPARERRAILTGVFMSRAKGGAFHSGPAARNITLTLVRSSSLMVELALFVSFLIGSQFRCSLSYWRHVTPLSPL